MNRRNFLVLTSAVAIVPTTACMINENTIIRYAEVAATAASSIGNILMLSNPDLGKQIIAAAHALLAAAEEWKLGVTGGSSVLVNALNALRAVLELIPMSQAQLVAALIPIVIAAISGIFGLISTFLKKPSEEVSSPTDPWKAATIPHHFGNSEEKDFKEEWNHQVDARSVQGAIKFKE